MLIVTLISLMRVDPGFDSEGLVAVRISSKPILGVALAASWIPAREAAGVDPVSTLNCE